MKKTEIKLLALKSFTGGKIDEKKVKSAVLKMKRKDLRKYIKNLRQIDSQSKIVIEVSNLKELDRNYVKKIQKAYPGKNIETMQSKDLILGVRITNNDLIYDYNLENSFEGIVEQI